MRSELTSGCSKVSWTSNAALTHPTEVSSSLTKGDRSTH